MDDIFALLKIQKKCPVVLEICDIAKNIVIEVIKLICEKYGLTEWEALRRFMKSETYSMLSDTSLEMWDFDYPEFYTKK